MTEQNRGLKIGLVVVSLGAWLWGWTWLARQKPEPVTPPVEPVAVQPAGGALPPIPTVAALQNYAQALYDPPMAVPEAAPTPAVIVSQPAAGNPAPPATTRSSR